MASSQPPPSSSAAAGADLAAAGACSGAAGAERPNQFDFGRGALARRSSYDSSVVGAHAHASSRALHVLQCAGGGPRGVRLRKKKLMLKLQWLAALLATNPGLPDSHRCSSKRSKMNYSSRSSNGVD